MRTLHLRLAGHGVGNVGPAERILALILFTKLSISAGARRRPRARACSAAAFACSSSWRRCSSSRFFFAASSCSRLRRRVLFLLLLLRGARASSCFGASRASPALALLARRLSRRSPGRAWAAWLRSGLGFGGFTGGGSGLGSALGAGLGSGAGSARGRLRGRQLAQSSAMDRGRGGMLCQRDAEDDEREERHVHQRPPATIARDRPGWRRFSSPGGVAGSCLTGAGRASRPTRFTCSLQHVQDLEDLLVAHVASPAMTTAWSGVGAPGASRTNVHQLARGSGAARPGDLRAVDHGEVAVGAHAHFQGGHRGIELLGHLRQVDLARG